MAQAMTFPKEFERNILRDLDKFFASVWFTTFVVFMSFCYYMQTLPFVEMTAEQLKKFNEAIYRVQIQKQAEPAPVAVDVDVGGATEVAGEEATEEETPTETEAPKELTQAEKSAARSAAKDARKLKAQAKMAAIAARLKTLTGPTAKGRKSRRGGASARRAVGLVGGAGGGADLKGALALYGDAASVGKIKQLRGSGAIGEDIGDISISDLRGFLANPDNLKEMLKGASIKIPKKARIGGGKASKKRQRSSKVILQKVHENQNQIKLCYWTYKRRDSSLKGNIVLAITINPAGAVTRVVFKQSKWGGNPLKKDVEKCIKNFVSQWRFEAIPESDGNVTAGGIRFILY